MSGRTPRRRARTLPSVSRPRARWLSPITLARSTILGTASMVADRDEGEPRRDAAPLEVEDERPRVGRQHEQADRQRDREEPDEGLRRELDALDGRVERSDLEEDGRPGSREDADEHHGDRDRQGQQERRPEQPAERRRRSGQDQRDRDDGDRADVAAQHERADRADGRDDGLGERVQPVVGGRRRRDEPVDELEVRGVKVAGPDDPGRRCRPYAPSTRPIACSPCGNRAT